MLYRPGKKWIPVSKLMTWTYNRFFWLTWGTKTQKGLQEFLFPNSNILTFQRQPSLLSQQEEADNSRESCIPALDTLSLMKS